MTHAAADAREGYVEVTGGRIWYRVVGRGSAIPLVTVHGSPGGIHDYLQPLDALADARPVVFYDQLGASPYPSGPIRRSRSTLGGLKGGTRPVPRVLLSVALAPARLARRRCS
jgi:hypothetical protein